MAKGKALPPFPRICCALSLSLFRCVLFLFMTSDDKKHERRKCCCEGRENFIFFTRFFARRIKSRRRDRNWSDFLVQLFLPKKRDKKETEFFSKQKLHSFLHLLLLIIIINTLLWCLSATFRRPRRKFLREKLLSKNTEREREREVRIFLFLKRRREL